MWSYRDWVIDAFNRNLPFDQFTIEQLAGDLLPNRDARPADRLRLQPLQHHDQRRRRRSTRSTWSSTPATAPRRSSQVWLGLTTGCAVCHDHKFDPLTQKEFYELAAFFNNTTQEAMDGNIQDTPPIIVVPRPRRPAALGRARRRSWPTSAGKVDARKQAARADFDKWLDDGQGRARSPRRVPTDGLRLHAAAERGQGQDARRVASTASRATIDCRDGFAWAAGPRRGQGVQRCSRAARSSSPDAGDFEKDQAFSVGAWVQAPQPRSDRRDRRPHGQRQRTIAAGTCGSRTTSVGMHIVNKWPDDALKVVAQDAAAAEPVVRTSLVTYDGSAKAAGVKVYLDGEPQPTDVAGRHADRARSAPTVPLRSASGTRASGSTDVAAAGPAALRPGAARRRRSSSSPKATRAADAARQAGRQADRRRRRTSCSTGGWRRSTSRTQELDAKLAALQQEEATIKARGTIAHVMQEKTRGADGVHPASAASTTSAATR